MPIEQPETMNIPRFELPNGLRFRGGRLSVDIERIGQGRAYELSHGSITHGDQANLYLIGLFAKNGLETGASSIVKDSAMAHYDAVHNREGFGNWNDDGIDYDAGVALRPGTLLPEGYDAFLWIIRPDWKLVDRIYVPVERHDSETEIAILPPNGYGPVPTIDGLRNPRTGWAIKTVPAKAKAIDLLAEYFSEFIDKSDARKLAGKEVSYSCRRARGNGKAAVFRDFDADDGGPFYEYAGWVGGGGSGLGAFSLG